MKVNELIAGTDQQAADPALIVELIKTCQRVGAASVPTKDVTTDYETPQSRIDLFLRQYDPLKHDIMDKSKIPDNVIHTDDGQKVEEVNRRALPFQKVIVNKRSTFLFGTPVDLVCQAKKEEEKLLLKAIQKIWDDAKLDALNREVARHLFVTTQVAECWYPITKKEKSDDYGFESNIRFRVQLFSALNGDSLYPYYDEYGDLVAFGRGVERTALIDGKVKKGIPHLEVYTDEETVIFRQIDNRWQVADTKPNKLKKIPIVYAEQPTVEWHDVQDTITRLEIMFSRFGDTNDYHSSPILFVKGALTTMAKKGSSKKVFKNTDGQGDMKYVSWDHAVDSVKLELETLLRFIHGNSQTPDLSFDSLKGLQAISGKALEMLLVDAKLSAQDKHEIFLPYLLRRIRILSAYVGIINTDLTETAKKLPIMPVINAFRVDDVSDLITDLSQAVAGKPIMSQREAVKKLGMVEDVDQEMNQIGEEERKSKEVDLGEPTTI
ncbi:phage portal protein [Fibrella sp. ES10-3-2-2]|nr:hypothetical protein A6C57_00235 [Fibrella sp. ES10-3-2-2]